MQFISIISIPVTDQQVAKAFYIKFGFELMIENPFQGESKWIQLSLPGAQTSVTLVNWFPDLKPGSIQGFVIKCDDLDATIAELQAKGITVGNADKTPWGRFATVKDPDGNSWSLHGK
ncbi:VOC family protein [Mucilaginibacter lutimaris]|uniref:VOC family protein n=1 Tax=Mucilaginibacter lutimaris TaxID=931629 RepID=A0ABW2ZM30_9SPHI